MDVIISPGELKGTVQAPPSKSLAHRALICAALADGTSVLHGISASEDMDATIACIQALGASAERQGDTVRVTGLGGAAGSGLAADQVKLDCGESGSTLRFMLPVAAALGVTAGFAGRGRLPERPVTELAAEMRKHGVEFEPAEADHIPLTISGRLTSGEYTLPGDVSSQYFSGLLMALPMLEGDSEVKVDGELQSSPYVDLTIYMMEKFGVHVEKTENAFRTEGGQRYQAADQEIEGDYSNAAFWLVAGATGSDIEVRGLNQDSIQGDRVILDMLSEMGASVTWNEGAVKVKGYGLDNIMADCGDIPDIVPILSVAACTSEDPNKFVNCGRLRLKESDRLQTTSAMLARLGADVEICGDDMYVSAPDGLIGRCDIDGAGDHRIVMSAAIAALRCEDLITIKGAEAVAKSYPDFFDVFRSLGGRMHVVTDR